MNDIPAVIGQSLPRQDGPDKARGQAKYTADLLPRNALHAKVLHNTIANGLVTSIDASAARALPGVELVLTCFEVPEQPFPTAGHPWSTEASHQDVCDRLLLNQRVRFVGDDIGAVVARDELTAEKALSLIKVKYEEYPPLPTMELALAA